MAATASVSGLFTILALDHGASFRKAMRPSAPAAVTFAEAVAAKQTLVRALAPHASGVLLDPTVGLAPAIMSGTLPGHTGLLVSVEDGDYASAGDLGRLLDDWGIAKVKQAGASAAKLFFYYNPDRAEAPAQEAFLAAVARDCERHDLPLFAEPVLYSADADQRRRLALETASRISRLGTDVLKVEFPVDVGSEPDELAWASASEALTAACAVPWVLLSAGADFELFARQVRVACRAGASGFVAGRAIWQEAVARSGEEREALIQQVAVPRLQRLAEIVEAHGSPWTMHYPDLAAPTPEGWHRSYSNLT